jgi:hypothetical protein
LRASASRHASSACAACRQAGPPRNDQAGRLLHLALVAGVLPLRACTRTFPCLRLGSLDRRSGHDERTRS